MPRKKKNHFVLMAINQQGMTFATLLFSLGVLSIMIPFFPFLFQIQNQPTYSDEFAIRQFFQFIMNETYSTKSLTASPTKLTFEKWDGTFVEFEEYGDIIRRQVSDTGHEILLRDVRSISFTESSAGITVSVTTLTGAFYEKKIRFVP
ncbi:ComGF family competence protein [Aquibacillus sp. 3ASR75-11]|uniref:ComGF family competence protein n=1 Tax=Terrihalobacillus insolitus TaxID=2950438 RepID=A0A9X3WUS7_9BACI|nr:ComGF family competence protein [Terrihalobacillus insolitus]MDC3413400.1 ComGF family competence protein [Terrihalobacillus insolitus]MDC3424983.1 ComGF family competence protein [Terrihalobacillus insolitus]